MQTKWKVLICVFVVLLVLAIGALSFFSLQPGNRRAYSFSKIEPLGQSPLQGKRICVLGSSVVKGMASNGDAVAEYIGARFGCDYTKEAVSGTTLCDQGDKSYIDRLLQLDTNVSYDLFICQLSTNDATKNLPLGEISSQAGLDALDTGTVTGALEFIIRYASETWGCPVVFFTGSHYDSAAYDAMVERLFELQKNYDIGILDLWHTRNYEDLDKAAQKLYMFDAIHPTKAGYRDWWGPALETQLIAYLQNNFAFDK